MAHNLEIRDGKALMSYVGEVPWHGLGNRLTGDESPQEFLEKTGLDWKVYISDGYTWPEGFPDLELPELDGVSDHLDEREYLQAALASLQETNPEVLLDFAFRAFTGRRPLGKGALIRDEDSRILSVVPDANQGVEWHPIQNGEMASFFSDFCDQGHVKMHSAGSISDGQRVWMQAKCEQSFDVGNHGDRHDLYLLFSNPHMYGHTADICTTETRVVCENTLKQALSGINQKNNLDSALRINHRRQFDPEQVQTILLAAFKSHEIYKEKMHFLVSKSFVVDNVKSYFNDVFPVLGATTGTARRKELSKSAAACMALLETQPGADLNPTSWYDAFHAVTYYTNHEYGRSVDTRMSSLWYGANEKLNRKALDLAVEYAENV